MRRGFVSTSFFLCRYAFSPPFPLDPRHEEIDDAPLPPGGYLDPARHFPPLREAVAAAAGAGMLCHKYGMSMHGCLPAVVGYVGRSQPMADKVHGMAAQQWHAQLLRVCPFVLAEAKACTKG